MRVSGENRLRALGAALILVVGAVHLQQYVSFIHDVPTIGVLFALNALGAGALCVGLATPLRALAALGGIGLSAGALVSIAISRYATSGLFSYREPTLRTPVLIAVVAEIASIAVLGAYLTRARRHGATVRTTA